MNEAKIKKISSMCTFICLFTISFFLASCGGGAPAEPAEPAETAIPSPTITPTPTQTATPTPTITPTEELGRYCIGEGGLWDGDEESPGDEELCKDGYLYYCLDSCDANSCTGRCKIDICNIDGAEVEIVEKFSTITVSTKFLCHGIDGWERLKGVPIESAEEPTETPTQEPTSEEPSDYQFSSPKGRVFFNEEGAQYNSDINSNKGILVITAENAGLKITRSFSGVITPDFAKMKAIENFFQDHSNGCIQVYKIMESANTNVVISLFTDQYCETEAKKSFTIEQVEIQTSGNIEELLEGVAQTVERTVPPGRIISDECPIQSWGIPYKEVANEFMDDPQKLHEGVYYKKQFYVNEHIDPENPIGNIIHTFKMDLDYIELYVTPYAKTKQTTTEFMRLAYYLFAEGYRTVDLKLDFAINGDGFTRDKGPYPVRGPHISTVYTGGRDGWVQRAYSRNKEYPALKYYDDGSVDIGYLEDNYKNILYAVGGYPQLIEEGCMYDRCVNGRNKWKDTVERFENFEQDARTAVGVDKNENVLIIVIAEGDNLDKKGMNLWELSCLLYAHGATDALNLDGGGSTTLVTRDGLIIDDENDDVDLIVNSNGNYPQPEQVKNHLGIRFK